MVKLISTIVIVVFVAFFTGFNLGNTCNVNLLFHTFKNVPVFFSIVISFGLGVLAALPFTFSHGRKLAEKKIGKFKEKFEKDAEELRKNIEEGKAADKNSTESSSSSSAEKK